MSQARWLAAVVAAAAMTAAAQKLPPITDDPDILQAAALSGLAAESRLTIRTAPERITLIHPPGHDYFRLLRSKLHWGRSGRTGSEEC